MSLLKELMNRGYMIVENDDGAVVHKCTTPTDKDPYIDMMEDIPEGSFGVRSKDFPSYDEALAFCKERIGWIEPDPALATANHVGSETLWQMELMYRHRGLGLQSAILGQLKHVPYDVAKGIAKERAEEYVQTFEKEDIEGWEIRVRPCVDR